MTTTPVYSIFDNGVTPLPKGKLATLVTYLAMEPLVRQATGVGHDLHFEQVTGQAYPRYREIFRQIGAPWLWFSRLLMPKAKVMAILDDPANLAFIVMQGGRDIGLCEVDCRNEQEAELAYLGLIPPNARRRSRYCWTRSSNLWRFRPARGFQPVRGHRAAREP